MRRIAQAETNENPNRKPADNLCGIPGIPRGSIEDVARTLHPEWFATNEKGLWDKAPETRRVR